MAARKSAVTGIDPDSWQVTLLPLPRGYSRGSVYGFCGGHAVGEAERLRSGSFGCWWPDRKPELLILEGKKYVASGRAGGDVIPGLWREASSEMRAAVWTLQNGRLVARVLHSKAFDQTWATASGGGVVIGMGKRPAEPDRRARTVGGLTRRRGELHEARSNMNSDVATTTCDGTSFTLDEITGAIIEESLGIHRDLGPGLLESVYEALLARALERRGLRVERQKLIRFEYDGMVFENGLRVDLLVESRVVVELKAVEQLARAQHEKSELAFAFSTFRSDFWSISAVRL